MTQLTELPESPTAATKRRSECDHVLIIGATSGIARALSPLLAARGCRLILAGRDQQELTRDASDLAIRYETDVFVESFDALAFEDHESLIRRSIDTFAGRLDGVVICHGTLPDASLVNDDTELIRQTIDINFTSVTTLLVPLANYFESRRSGFIAVISSVAGDRGRQSNYAYGSAKAGLTAYLQGLRNRLHPAGVHVLTVKPGMVSTRMTHGICNPASPLVASPERVARDIDRAIRHRRDVLYTPWFWRGIMHVIRAIPEFLFKRLKL